MANTNIKPYSKSTVLTSSSTEEKKEKKTGKTTYEIWLSRLNSTLKWRQFKYDKEWKRAYRMFKGDDWRDRGSNDSDPSSDEARDRITVKATMSAILNLGPFLMQANPEFVCKARQPKKTVAAALQSAVLNYEFEQRKMYPKIKKVVYDAITIGHGIAKTGYILELDEAATKSEGEIVYEDYIKQSAPYVKRICPFNFLIDPTASEQSLESARWCAEIFYKTKRDVVTNTRYDSSVRNKIAADDFGYTPTYKNSTLASTEDLNNLSIKETDDPALPESQLMVLFEVWDKKYKKYYVFADGVCEPLLEKDWPYEYIDNFPYIKVDYIDVADELYGVGVPYCIEDQQFELNRIRTGAFDHRRRFQARKYEVHNSISESELNKLIEGEDGAIVRVNAMGQIAPIPDAPIPQDSELVEAMIRSDIQEQTGLDQLLRGGQLPSRTTSGEVSTRTSLFRLKLDDRVEAIDMFIRDVGTQVLQHIKNNFDSARVMEIVGEQGAYWETLTPEMIREEVDVSMESVAAPKVDPLLDRQQRLQIWQICMQSLPLIQANVLKIDFNELFKWVLEGMGIKEAGRFFNYALTPTPPLEEQPANLNNLSQGQEGIETQEPPDFASMFQQVAGASINNQSGLQLGG